jgi:phosphoribosylformylglycinamidine (FGAM) synthase PurS component
VLKKIIEKGQSIAAFYLQNAFAKLEDFGPARRFSSHIKAALKAEDPNSQGFSIEQILSSLDDVSSVNFKINLIHTDNDEEVPEDAYQNLHNVVCKVFANSKIEEITLIPNGPWHHNTSIFQSPSHLNRMLSTHRSGSP